MRKPSTFGRLHGPGVRSRTFSWACLLLLCSTGVLRAASFTNFETGHVRPLAMSPSGGWLFAVNTPDARLAVYALSATGAALAAEVPVGLEPVAVASRMNAAGRTEAWVVNHLSDSVSVVEVDPVDVTRSHVTRTLLVGDEPRDILFAGPAGGRAFITAAHRGQNRPGDPQLTTEGVGRADVWVFDAESSGAALGGTPLTILQLFGDTPRALAKSPDGSTVYAAVFHSGNRTTTVLERVVSANGGLPPAPAGATPGAPNTALIVQFDGTRWADELGRDWSVGVPFSLPDRDVFRIDANANPPTAVAGDPGVAGVGTVLFNMAVRPTNGKLFVSNTEARNRVRFEPTLRGHVSESRISVVDGTTVTPVHLNPHIDFDATPGPATEVAQSIAFPTDMVFSADGATLYVAALGSSAIAVVDAAALEAGVVSRALIPVGDGPSGLVLDAARDRLFVMNRIGHSVSIITRLSDPRRRAETTRLALGFDPSPASTKNGRRFLYDAAHTSGHGDTACASCHVFGDFDSVAWDLGDPFGAVMPNPNPMVPGIAARPFHPLKGPMATQSLRGLAAAGPMHWRGDRTGASDPGGDALDEAAAFAQFNPAFVSLLGNARILTDGELQQFTDFILSIRYPPNPIRALDGSLNSAQQAGQDFFMNAQSDGPRPCNACHALPLGTTGSSANDGEPQDFKIAHLRNAYQKIGMFGLPPSGANPGVIFGDQVRGVGFLHNGGVSTIFQFLNAPRFSFGTDPNTNRRNVEQFILSLDTGVAPIVGQQVTLGTNPDAGAIDRLNLLLARADAGDCDVVVKGLVNGVPRGWLYGGAGSFLPDRAQDAVVATSTLVAMAAVAEQAQTFTAVPLGIGRRAAIDRDLDGALDRDELDAGTNVADPSSHPGGPAFTLIQVTRLQLDDGTTPPNPGRRRLSFTSKTSGDLAAQRIVPPPPSGPGDPTLHGATLIVYDAAGTGETATIPLAAGGWSRTGSLATPTYQYRKVASTDPISRVSLQPDRVRVSGGGAGLAYTLDEPRQGRLALRLVLGTALVLCTEASPRAAGQPPTTAKSDRTDRFKAAPRTPAPVSCPQLPIDG